MISIGVVGSRSITEYEQVRSAIWSSPWVHKKGFTPKKNLGYEIVSGGADGVDKLAERFCEQYGWDITIIEPNYDDWSGNEHPAKRRNTKIVEESDKIIAVWDGHSNGTHDTINKALDRGLPIYVEVIEQT